MLRRQDIVNSLKKRKLISHKGKHIFTENVHAISYRDILDLYMSISGSRGCVWVDKEERVSRQQNMFLSVKNILKDLILWPFFYRKYSTIVLRMNNNCSASHTSENSLLDILYIRSNHWFGVKSGGSVGHIAGVINGMRERNCKVHVVSTDHLPGVPENNYFHLCPPMYVSECNIPQMPHLMYNEQLYNFIVHNWDKWHPSLIYQRSDLGNFTGAMLKHRYKVPFICEYNSSDVWKARNWNGRRLLHEKLMSEIELLNLRMADLVVVVSKALKDQVVARGISPQKILINPNGVNSSNYSPQVNGAITRQIFNLDNQIVIGFIGTFGQWHGTEVLAEAFGQLLTEHPEYREKVRLLLVGDGERMSIVKDNLAKWNVQDYCIFTGLVPQEDGPAYLAACDILVNSTIPNPDGSSFFGSPTKLFEYMAMGKGIVCSNMDQMSEILEHKKTAFMVEPGNANSLARGLKFMLDNPKERESMGKEARKIVVEKHTWKIHTKRIIDALQERLQ